MNIEGNCYNKMIKGEERQGFPFVLSLNKIKSSQKRVIYILYIYRHLHYFKINMTIISRAKRENNEFIIDLLSIFLIIIRVLLAYNKFNKWFLFTDTLCLTFIGQESYYSDVETVIF